MVLAKVAETVMVAVEDVNSMQVSGEMTQMRVRKMDGTGGGNGQGNGMRDVMQALSPDDRTAFRESLSTLSQEDRQSIKESIGSLDITTLSADELSQTLADFLSSLEQNTLSQTTLPTTTLDITA